MAIVSRIFAGLEASGAARLLDRLRSHFAISVLRVRPDGGDIMLAMLMGTIATAIAIHAMALLPLSLYEPQNINVWFHADLPRVLHAMADRTAYDHYRSSVHPLFPLLTSPIVALLRASGMGILQAADTLVLASAFLTTALLSLLLRMLGMPRLIASLGCGIFMTSATFLNWFVVVETYAFSGLSMVAALYLLVRAQERSWMGVFGSLVALAITVTNWSLAVIYAVLRWPLGKAARILLLTLLIGAGLAIAQHAIFPNSRLFFMPKSVGSEVQWTQPAMAAKGDARWTPLANVGTVLLSSAVARRPYASPATEQGHYQVVVNDQQAPLASSGLVGGIALLSWGVMLVIAIGGTIIDRRVTALFATLCLFTLGQLALHLVYGDVTFLFVANFFPMLLVLAMHGYFTRFRVLHVVASCCFLVTGAMANTETYRATVALAAKLAVTAQHGTPVR